MTAESFYKYLGIETGAYGTRTNTIKKLEKKLDDLRRAPLKPQQRIWILKTYCIPSVYHQLVLAKTTKQVLGGIDRVIRRTVRQFLRWPKDTPKEMFHADVDDGGLGIPELQKRVPLMQESRLTRLMRDEDPAVAALTQTVFFKKLLESIEAARPTVDSVTPHSIAELRIRQGDRLHTTVDGAGLKTVRQCGGHGILTNGTLLMTGSTFIAVMKIRGNLMTTKAKMQRWHKGQDPSCDACGRRETLAHILQVCPRSWGERIRRHDKCVDLAKGLLEKQGYSTLAEPVIKTRQGIRKPDLVVWKDEQAWVIDGIICSDNAVLDDQYQMKANYYQVPEVVQDVMCRTQARSVTFGALVMSWRGAMAQKTWHLLWNLGLKKSHLQLLIVRCLEGSARTFQQWKRSGFTKWSQLTDDDG